jgi:hypothetical protein
VPSGKHIIELCFSRRKKIKRGTAMRKMLRFMQITLCLATIFGASMVSVGQLK